MPFHSMNRPINIKETTKVLRFEYPQISRKSTKLEIYESISDIFHLISSQPSAHHSNDHYTPLQYSENVNFGIKFDLKMAAQ